MLASPATPAACPAVAYVREHISNQHFVDFGDRQCLQTEAVFGDPREEVLVHRASSSPRCGGNSPVPQHMIGEFSDVFGVGPMGHSLRLQASQEGKLSAGLAGEPEPRESGVAHHLRGDGGRAWEWPAREIRPRLGPPVPSYGGLHGAVEFPVSRPPPVRFIYKSALSPL